MKTIIMAGGKGTRISTLYPDCPKPMIQIAHMPILEHQIRCLKRYHMTDLIFVTGHMKEQIQNYFGDGKNFGVTISYFEEDEPLGTAGALYQMKHSLQEDFLLINGDILFDINLDQLINFHQKNKALATLVAHPNTHPFDSALLVVNEQGQLLQWLHKEESRDHNKYYHNLVNAGIHILSPKTLQIQQVNKKKVDLDRDILKPLIQSGQIFAYRTPEYIKDMGTPERYQEASQDYARGFVEKSNLSNKQAAVFLDRDGTINQYRGFITEPSQLELIKNAAKAIKMIVQKGYLPIIVTNQPVIARGDCTFETLDQIHARLETLLGNEGAYISDIFFCPHHPDKGFEGERAEFKIDCTCRKPKPGLLLKAAKQYHIDLNASYMVGDQRSDILAGIAAGCKSILLSDSCTPESCNPTECYHSLYDFAVALPSMF